MAVLDTFRNALKPDDKQGREQLDILKKAATGELNAFFSAYEKRFTNPDGFRGEIVPTSIINQMYDWRVDLKEGASEEISKIVDIFLESDPDIKTGFANMIKFAFEAILGSTSIGEQKTQNWYIAVEYGALIRTDIMAWRYNFEAEGVISTAQNAFCYVASKAFVDPNKLNPSQIRYFIAKSLHLKDINEIMSHPLLEKYVELLIKDWRKDITLEDYQMQLNASRKVRYLYTQGILV